jgi:hypothetical protein
MNDVRKMIYGAIVGFFVVMAGWFSIVYVSSCGFTFTCNRAEPIIIRTPVPTLIPAAHEEAPMGTGVTEFKKCRVAAVDLIGAWVSAGTPESDRFPFEDVNGNPCEGTYADDVQYLFVESNLWQPRALGCTSCHNAELSGRSAGLDLSTYDAVLLGSRRVPEATSPGTDILGRGEWENSLLYTFLANRGLVPEGHSADIPADVLVVYAGERLEEAPTK